MQLEEFIAEALKYLGFPAIKYTDPFSGCDPDSGFDCSGFVTYLLKKFHINNPEIRHCREYFDYFGILVHDGLQRKGDLVIFSKNGFIPNHIGIMISKSRYIHSTRKKGKVTTVKLIEESIPELPAKVINGIRYEQIYNKNPIGFKRFLFA